MSYYQHMRQHYGLNKLEAAWEVVMAWFRGDIENRKNAIQDNLNFNPEGIPTLFNVFSMIRAHVSELESSENPNSWTPDRIIAELKNIGDYDEPLSLLIRDALDGKLDARSRALLEYIVSESV